MRPWSLAALVAERQHLVITSWQLRHLGLSSAAVTTRVRRDGWSRPWPGVLLLPGPDTPLRRHAAALLSYARPTHAAARVHDLVGRGATVEDALVSAAMGCGVALGGRSSAWLLRMLPAAPAVVSVRVGAGQNRVTRPGVDLQRRESLTVRIVEGLPVLAPYATLADCAAATGDAAVLHHDLARMAATADALRSLPLDDFVASTRALGRRPGSSLLRAVAADLRGQMSHSATEGAARGIVGRVLDRRGLVVHPRPLAIELGGRKVGEADIPCDALRLDVEIDGPHHLLPAQQERDRARDRMVRQAEWHVERFPTSLIDTDPRGFERQVAGVVDSLLRQRRTA